MGRHAAGVAAAGRALVVYYEALQVNPKRCAYLLPGLPPTK